MTIAGYLTAFVLVAFFVTVAMDAYLCQAQGVASGVMRDTNINLASSGDADMTLQLKLYAYFQSRLHTVTVDAGNCAMHIDTSDGRRMNLMDASMVQSGPMVLAPRPLWSSFDGKAMFAGYASPKYYVEGTVALSRVNFASVGDLLLEALVKPQTGSQTLGADCAVDVSLRLFGVPSWSVSMKQYKLSAHREFSMPHATTAESSAAAPEGKRALAATNDLQRRALNTVTDVASRLKSFLSSLPALGPSLENLSAADYERLVDTVATSPESLLYYLLYPIFGANINSGEVSEKSNAAVTIPPSVHSMPTPQPQRPSQPTSHPSKFRVMSAGTDTPMDSQDQQQPSFLPIDLVPPHGSYSYLSAIRLLNTFDNVLWKLF